MARLPTLWKTKTGCIKISDMSTIHLKRTIAMLQRQIDGSAHDDFCWDNITAMQNELKERNKDGKDCKCGFKGSGCHI